MFAVARSVLTLLQSVIARSESDAKTDGGGVRGLSTLLILKGIMQQLNAKRRLQGLSYVRPCDVFDLIGGTSTGG